MNILATIDWSQVGTAIAMVVIAFFTYWNKRKSDARDKVIEKVAEKVDNTAIVVGQVKTLSDGYLSEQLQIGMTSALALALSSGSKEHQDLADTAVKKYQEHKKQLDLVSNEAKLKETE